MSSYQVIDDRGCEPWWAGARMGISICTIDNMPFEHGNQVRKFVVAVTESQISGVRGSGGLGCLINVSQS